MKSETLELYKKYRYYLFIIDDGRHPYFFIDETTLDYEKFFEHYNYVVCMHWRIKPIWKEYKKRQNMIIKKFEYGKYEILLRPHFCADIRKLIISFISLKI